MKDCVQARGKALQVKFKPGIKTINSSVLLVVELGDECDFAIGQDKENSMPHSETTLSDMCSPSHANMEPDMVDN